MGPLKWTLGRIVALHLGTESVRVVVSRLTKTNREAFINERQY